MDNESSIDHSENASFAFSNADRDSVSISTRNSEGKIFQDVQETRLVIGLDYGTTYTGMLLTHILDRVCGSLAQLGVAYATPSGAYCSLEDIDVMVEWGK
jgi:hypothetical protein